MTTTLLTSTIKFRSPTLFQLFQLESTGRVRHRQNTSVPALRADAIMMGDKNYQGSSNNNNSNIISSEPFPHSPPPPTIQDLAEALDDVEETEETSFVSDDNNNDDNEEEDQAHGDYDTNQKPSQATAYTATTVAAISSLMSDDALIHVNTEIQEGSHYFSPKGERVISSATSPATASTKKSRELTLQDRASAMISVYKDYIHEEIINNDDDDNDDDDATNSQEEIENEGSSKNLHDIRRREIKNATLQKFCKDVLSLSSSQEEEEDDDDDDEYIDSEDEVIDDTTGSNLGRGAHTYSNILMHGSGDSASSPFMGRWKKRQIPPTPRPKLHPPTAASTTAAFRLRAEVALKAVSTKTSNAAKRTAHAMGMVVRDKMTNTANIQEMTMNEVKNDYDFQEYHHSHAESKATTSANSSNSKEGQRGGRGGGVQGERLDDLEYGQISKTPADMDKNNIVYGMHILDRDTSSSFRRKIDAKDEEIFHELCDELGVTPETHPRIRYFYEPPPSSASLRYRYPIFRSKKVQQAMLYLLALLLLLLVGVSIISAVSNGFEEVRRKNGPPLPDWKGADDWQMKQKLEWETKTELFEKVSAAYQPVWYDRSTGWKGQTYDEALSWCKSYLNYIPCPYEVYCPDEKTLLSGVMEKGGESWAPVINAKNEWVQVGSVGKPCALFSMLYGSHPAWGKNGAKDEVTRNIMCCRSQPFLGAGSSWNDTRKGDDEYVVRPKTPPKKYEGYDGEQPQQHTSPAEVSPGFDLDVLFFSVSKKYNPVWFDRSSGWKGQSYQDALDFCANFKGYIPCPYDAYCPGGRGKLLDGIKEDGESWAAVIDKANDWVQVGTGGTCNLYSETAKEPPSWGVTGQNNEKITRHIMCCDEEPYIAVITGNEVGSSPADSTTAPPFVVMPEPPDNSMTVMEIDVADFYKPEWFDADSGWMGTTYAEAKAFCSSIPRGDNGDSGDTLHLCPSEAVCPNGPRDTKPLFLQLDAFEDVQWTPISDSENGWLMVGTIVGEEEFTCHTYAEIFQRDPDWGLDGSSPAVVKHVLCCEDNSRDGDSSSQTGNGIFPLEVGISTENMTDEGEINEDSISAGENTPVGGVVVSETSANTPSAVSSSVISKFSPMWFTADEDGWNGGSHDDAIAFCQQFAGSHGTKMNICPYAAYCPQGPTEPVLGGHDANFDEEGQQWAPLYGQSNHWVMIGKKGTNMSTTCLTHVQLTGEEPSWGLDGSHNEMKKHLMCCSSLQ